MNFSVICGDFKHYYKYRYKKDIPTVPFVDLNRYTGKWYEIARIDNFFEKDCGFEDNGPEANYELMYNGDISVLNTCYKLSNGELKQTLGRASIINSTSNAQLYVNFIPGLKGLPGSIIRLFVSSGNYWIFKLVESADKGNYELAYVGSENGKYYWLLSRTRSVEKKVIENFLKFGNDNNFKMENIVTVRSPVGT